MEPSISVLLTGFNKPTTTQNVFRAGCTVSLIIHGNATVLVDCGSPWQKVQLSDALATRKICPGQVTHVVCTHSHIDHIGNLNLFPNAVIYLDIDMARSPDTYTTVQYPLDITDKVQVYQKPGHTDHDLIVSVSIEHETYVISGDIFESEEDLKDDQIWQANSRYPEKQEIARQFILNMANYIVPGHGDMFRVQ